MEHSKKFSTVEKYYNMGLWTIHMVKNAVEKEWITADEYQEITGEQYEVGENK